MHQRTIVWSVTLGLALCALTGCTGEGSATEVVAAESDIVASSNRLGAEEVTSAIERLERQRTSDPLRSYYADGSRIEGCWRNPAGDRLTDLQKAFYCAMPLELRLCNTVALLAIDEAQVDDRYEAYLGCQKRVDAVFGGTGGFIYGPDIDEVYRRLFLEKATLSAAETAAIVDANKPDFSDRPFAVVLVAIAATLASQASELVLDGLSALVADYRHETDTEPR